MDLRDYLLEQLEREGAASRKTLERVPEGRNSWKPHGKSMEMGMLAALVATMPAWIAVMVERDELDLDKAENEGLMTKPVETRAELLKALDGAMEKGRKALSGVTEEHLKLPWRFVYKGHALDRKPRYVMIADSVFAHLAHHRGQLTVYMRLNEASVPALYGPSADEQH
ncbi:MAG: DinB family protein [Acidobacteriota bacterium]|nr:DinB family protein [Acidobacteriota bacterium]